VCDKKALTETNRKSDAKFRRYGQAFKHSAVELLLSGKSVKQIVNELGITRRTLVKV
jgi:transposase-like protein